MLFAPVDAFPRRELCCLASRARTTTICLYIARRCFSPTAFVRARGGCAQIRMATLTPLERFSRAGVSFSRPNIILALLSSENITMLLELALFTIFLAVATADMSACFRVLCPCRADISRPLRPLLQRQHYGALWVRASSRTLTLTSLARRHLLAPRCRPQRQWLPRHQAGQAPRLGE